MPYCKTQGIVLKIRDYSETSQLVWLLTRDYGKIHGLAKGARRPKKGLENGFDLLNLCGLVFLRKDTTSLHLLTEWQVRETFQPLRRRLDRLYAALYMAELILELVQESEEDEEIFVRLVESLGHLADGHDSEMVLFRFELGLLAALGLAPETSQCAHCRQRLGARSRFDPESGGALCAVCAEGRPAAVRVSAGALATMTRLADATTRARLTISAQMRAEIRGALGDYLTRTIGRPPRMLKYVSALSQQEAKAR